MKTDLEGWVEFHRAAKDEALFVIADTKDRAIGHVGLKINPPHLPRGVATNERAIKLYRSLGFVEEGRLRQTRWQQGKYVDVLLMGLLIEEYRRDAP